MCISQKLRDEIWRARSRGTRFYELARAADLQPNTFSAIVNGIVRVRAGDPRVARIGAVMGVPPEECFEQEPAAV